MAQVGMGEFMTLIQQINNLRKLVTINGKEYKWDAKSKTYKPVKGKAKPLTKQAAINLVKGQNYKAPNVPKKEKPKNKLKVKTTPKAKTTKTNPLKVGMNKLNQFTQNQQYNRGRNTINTKRTDGKLRFGADPGAVGKDGMTRGSRATVNNMMPGRKGGTIPTIIAGSLLGEGGLDPGGHLGNWIGNRLLPGPDRTLQENNALRAQLLAEKEINKQNKQLMIKVTQGIENPQQTGGAIGRSRQDPYLNRPTPTPTPKKEEPKEKVKVSKKKEKKSDTPYWQSPRYTETKTKNKKLKVNKSQERRKKAIRRAYGNISDKRMKQLLSRAVTQRELEES